MEESIYFLDHMIAYTDGASNPHRKRSGVGIAWFYPSQMVYATKGETLKKGEKPCACYAEEIFSNRPKVEYPTNNDAEYISLIKAMENAIEAGTNQVTVFMDSKLVVNQVKGLWNINYDHLRNYKARIDVLKTKIKLNIYHVRREYNQWADYQSKLAINENTEYMDRKFKF